MKGHLSLVVVVAFIASEVWGCPGFHQHGLNYKRASNPHIRSKRQAEDITCTEEAYRTFDGSCHNLENKAMGQTGSVFRRLLEPVYEDGKGMPKLTGSTGNLLMNPRFISVQVHDPLDRQNRNDNHMVMQWGQFLDHDITLTPTATPTSDCCSSWDSNQSDHPDVAVGGVCDPIILPANDAYFSNDQRCMTFERSDNVTDADGVRQQYNLQTAWIDGSHIYGTTEDMALSLRTMSGGKLLAKTIGGKEFLPEDVDADTNSGCFLRDGTDDYCFLAGDVRVMAYPGLNAMHTIFLRWHNVIADKFATLRPEWNDEDLFQQARRVVVATLQKISYDEFLPILLGADNAENVNLQSTNPYTYTSSVDASLPNVFSTAAFRYGHSMIGDSLTIDGAESETGVLFNRPSFVLDNLVGLVQSLLVEPIQRTDRWYTAGMTDQMFEKPGQKGSGSDIAARNIQRGRDHGLPSYNDWKAYCNQPGTTDFDLDGSGGTMNRFRRSYTSVDDIDLYSGGVSESPAAGAQVGDLYVCLLGRAFNDLKFGDRFWYQNDFNTDQASEIDRLSLASIMCETMEISEIQQNAFAPENRQTNPAQNCDQFPQLVLTDWLNEVAYQAGESPVTEAPVTEAPVTEAPVTEAPVTEAPVTEAPATEAPVTEAPVTEAPVTEAPVTQPPVTQGPPQVRPRPPQRRPRKQQLKRLIELLDAELE